MLACIAIASPADYKEVHQVGRCLRSPATTDAEHELWDKLITYTPEQVHDMAINPSFDYVFRNQRHKAKTSGGASAS
jgi:hypothetical protein